MSELQETGGITFDSEGSEAPQPEQQTEAQVKPEESGSDLAPDSPAEGEQSTENGKEALSEGAQKAINKQHFKYREEQRKRLELEERLKALEAKQAPQEVGDVTIPPIPDSWDENFEDKIRQREEAIQRKAAIDARQQASADQEAISQREQQRQELERSQKLNDQFTENAKTLGVSQQSLDVAQQTVIDYGITPELATALISDADGPLMVQHLAANPLELHDLVHASPLTAGMMLAEVKAKAAALKPKSSEAPDPATTLNGKGAPVKERGPKGATFE
jgi:hypothetical protein